MRTTLAAALLTLALSIPVRADSLAAMSTPAGTSAVVKVTLTVTSSFGTSTDDDTKTMTTSGTTTAELTPTSPPFTTMQLQSMHVVLGSATFNFQLYCFPFVGCQSLNVTVTNLTFDLVAPVSSAIAAGGYVNYPATTVSATGNYSTTGISVSSGVISGISTGSASGRITPAAGIATYDQLVMAPQTYVVPPASLPPGISALTIVVDANLANTKFVGPITPIITGDLNGDGKVDGADLGILIGSWNTATNDLNGDGIVNGADLGILIGAWTG